MEKEVTRRDALKLAAGAAALGAALGVPRSALAMGALGEKIFIKFYYAGKFWHGVDLTDDQVKQLSENPAALTIKIFRGGTESLGSVSLTPEVQLKVRAAFKQSR